jgi:hypothetical protein
VDGFIEQNHKLAVRESAFVDNELSKLIQCEAIVKSLPSDGIPKCVSPIGCTPKKSNQLRLIIDMRTLNNSLRCPSFQYDDINTVCDLIEPNDEIIYYNIGYN